MTILIIILVHKYKQNKKNTVERYITGDKVRRFAAKSTAEKQAYDNKTFETEDLFMNLET